MGPGTCLIVGFAGVVVAGVVGVGSAQPDTSKPTSITVIKTALNNLPFFNLLLLL